MKMKLLILIGAGGCIGSILRYILSGVPYKFLDSSFPYGTLLVNFLGALLIGLFMEFSLTRSYIISDTTRMFIAFGILGGFTTFSAFSYETIVLLKAGNYLYASINILFTNLLCLGGTFTGIKLISLFKQV